MLPVIYWFLKRGVAMHNLVSVLKSRVVALLMLGVVGLGLSSPTWATIDVTAAVSGIGDAQTALLAVIAALTALSIAILGVVMVYRFIKRRAGA